MSDLASPTPASVSEQPRTLRERVARHSLVQLTAARLRLFFREPSAVFWAFGFPIILSIALGIAFRDRPPEPVHVGVLSGPGSQRPFEALQRRKDVDAKLLDAEEARQALKIGKIVLLVTPGSPRLYSYDPTRPESRLARLLVDDVLQRDAGRSDSAAVADRQITEEGSRYIDFLVPGLIGMNIMQSGMWGIGYMIVEMRTRKLLKRMLATPMKRSHFLLSFVLMRMLFLCVELPVLVGVPWLVFGVKIRGSLALFALVSFAGALAFSGLSLLIASRAQNTQTVGGLMNAIMMPMFVLSGVFFSSANFPEVMQPVIHALPLTALNDSLRAIMNESAGLAQVGLPLALMGAIAAVSFAIALRIFRWN